MINEFYHVEKGLIENNVDISMRSDAIKNATKTPCFIFSTAKVGLVGVEFIRAEDMAKRWKIAETKHKSFPIINLNEPLFSIADSDAELFENELSIVLRNKKLVDFITYSFGLYEIKLNSNSKHIKRFTDSCYSYPKSLLERFKDDVNDVAFFRLSRNLCDWFGESILKDELQKRGEQFVVQMVNILCKNILRGQLENADAVARALFGKWNKKNKKFESPGVQIGFCIEGEIDNSFWDSYEKVNELLLSESTSTYIGSCALTGKQEPLITNTFPEITLNGVGQTRLFSMFNKVPAQYRYRKSGAEIFPASEEKILKIANAIQTICAPEQEGRTWQTIPSAKPGKKDLLIAWLSGARVVEQNNTVKKAIAQLCFLPDTLDEISQYEVQVREIIESFNKPNINLSFDDIQKILILTQVDKSRREVVANLSYNLETVAMGISSWAQLSEEHISFRIPVKFTGGNNIVMLSPYIPSPASIMELYRRLYLQCGRIENIKGVSPKKVLDILLKPPIGPTGTESELLKQLLKCVSELLINIRNDQIICSQLWKKGKKKEADKMLKPYSKISRLDILVSISFFAILLGRIEKGKRRYQMSAIYQLGRLLAKADELHLAYSHVVRKEDIPSQLLGNSLMRIAMQTPIQALERLGERIIIYQNWAKVHREQNKDDNVGMLLSQIGKISRDIDLNELEQAVTSKTKAALLLGYLAWETRKIETSGGE